MTGFLKNAYFYFKIRLFLLLGFLGHWWCLWCYLYRPWARWSDMMAYWVFFDYGCVTFFWTLIMSIVLTIVRCPDRALLKAWWVFITVIETSFILFKYFLAIRKRLRKLCWVVILQRRWLYFLFSAFYSNKFLPISYFTFNNNVFRLQHEPWLKFWRSAIW